MNARVRHFRQICIWPLQVMPIRIDGRMREAWDVLEHGAAAHPWRDLRDEFSCAPEQYAERHYSEFVTFLPYVRRFLYGEGKGRGALPGVASPIRVFRRSDIAGVRMTFPSAPGAPVSFDVAHVDLCFFYDLDVAILVVELFADDLPLDVAQDAMYRFGRAYPTFWNDDDSGGNCLVRCEWIGRDGAAIGPPSDYGEPRRYLEFVGRHRAPCFAAHWTWLLSPLVHDHAPTEGPIRYRQIEYARMPILSYLAMDDARALRRADFVRLGLVTGPGSSDASPYSARHMQDFEARYCFDQYWNEEREGPPGTRFMSCGHGFAMVGDASDNFFIDRDGGLLGQFRHQYFLLFLIPHIHKATLLMLSDRMVDALNHLDIRDAESVKTFKRTIRHLLEVFLRFTHRYWFHEVSDQPAARELYRLTSAHLGTDPLYSEIRNEIEDMSDYLETDTLRRQANTVVRLTVVTSFGLVGTVATGFLGMNLFSLAEASTLEKVAWFVAVLVPVTALTFYTIMKSKRLSDFLESLSDERLPAAAKVDSLVNVWRREPRAPGASRSRMAATLAPQAERGADVRIDDAGSPLSRG